MKEREKSFAEKVKISKCKSEMGRDGDISGVKKVGNDPIHFLGQGPMW